MDIGGNDKYNLSATYSEEDENFVTVMDYAGNDNYTLANGSAARIQDSKGKDTYTIKENSSAQINEFGGNDKYIIENTEQTKIQDKAGKDKYTVSNAEQFAIYESAGNDTYKLTNVQTTDEHGVINPNQTLVGDVAGNDKYTVSGSDTYLLINDKSGKDTYNLDTNADFTIYNYGATGDSYTLKKSNNGYVCDYNGNDKYTISNMVFNPKITEDEILAGITIDDRGGNKDTLTLKTTKKDNIVYMSNFDKYDGKYRSCGNSLIIYDKSTQGFVNISNFYSANEDYDFTGFGDGVIETIKASKKKLDVSTMAYLDSVKADVVEWLVTQSNQEVDFTCVEDVLIYGSNEQKAELVAFFDQSGK